MSLATYLLLQVTVCTGVQVAVKLHPVAVNPPPPARCVMLIHAQCRLLCHHIKLLYGYGCFTVN